MKMKNLIFNEIKSVGVDDKRNVQRLEHRSHPPSSHRGMIEN